MSTTLRRYTNLAAALHLLSTRKITLLDPSTWQDKNDSYFMSVYTRQCAAQSVLAICLTAASETFHHWRIYSNGTDGVCIDFEKDSLLRAFEGDARIRHGKVEYKRMKEVSELSKTIGFLELPFLKRWPYRDENEYRIIFTDMHSLHNHVDYSIDLSSIQRITLSPWMSDGPDISVKKIIKQIPNCEALKVYRSKLVQTEAWKQLAEKVAAERTI